MSIEINTPCVHPNQFGDKIIPPKSSDLTIKVRKQMVSAIAHYNLIEDGDKVLVAVSGGKDSTILLTLLEEIRKRAPFKFEIQAAILDQNQPGFDIKAFKQWINNIGLPLTVLSEDTYSIVQEKTPEGKTFCSLCSRLRRGILYNYAYENGFNKIALGHHRDDLIETLLMNMFYSGKLATMAPSMKAKDERNTVIRPLCFVREEDLTTIKNFWDFPVVPCNLCGSQDGLKRAETKALMNQLRKTIPDIDNSLLNAMGNYDPKFLL